MEHFVVSARKYRPKTFKDVVGQQAITNTLLNAIDNNHLAQALLFCGPRGVGKTTCARILAKKINDDGTHAEDEDFAFNVFELDAASNNSVDDIRSLIDQVRIPPQVGKYKVYIIDEVHMLSQAAFNAFLKTLEEPPKHAIFILATTEKHKIIPTILSRCQIFDFKRITVKDAKEYLHYIAENQGIEAEDDALHIIAQKADGAMRDALSIFDRVVSFAGKNLSRQAVTENLNVLDYQTYFEATDLILDGDIPKLLVDFNKILSLGFDGHHFIAGLASHFRDLLVCQNEATIPLLEVGDEAKQKYLEQSKKAPREFLLKGIEIANTCDLNYRSSRNQRLLVELSLMKLASITHDGEKKKGSNYIIPPSFYRVTSKETTNKVPQKVSTTENKPAETSVEKKAVKDAEEKKPEAPKVNINLKNKSSVSGLSLSSIKKKKAHELAKKNHVVDEANLPEDPFDEPTMQKHWDDYVKKIDNEGKKILGSALGSDTPRLKGKNTIWIELANDTLKKEVERDQYPLMEYLKEHLNNYHIELYITINEEVAKQYAFTPQEKYEKLREKNPLIDRLRMEFDLDV
ncbi:DNA polymerase III subunit gamma/tau [Galbibacter orientalis]|uniref:DNA polymerase III subunit gamma/tau n=1 Tax=Galbibacter orientalis DSM 19592 TaxID=926559 RepID=I3C0M4_9FLAO|nr:DNA polymerase III subunit gamma/tau [Galbibacter orientalis]EIJ37167.1 DNA polymerase III, subunit gamma/tau [Galbibacter orientalis DSM 19592]